MAKNKRGKVKARELKNVRVGIVSVVTRGANAEGFEIFKAAEAASKATGENSTEVPIDKKDIGVFERILNMLKGKSNEEEISMSKAEEILEALKGLTGKVDAIGTRVDKLENVENDDGDGDGDGDGENPPATGDGDAAGSGESTGDGSGDDNAAASSDGDDDKKKKAAEAAKAKAKKDAEGTEDGDNEKVLNAIKGVGEKIDSLTKRVEKVEKTRTQSNAITNDKSVSKEDVQATKDDDTFDGVFGAKKSQ